LLVGEPTDERISNLNGGGDYVSFDYSAATDNIKAPYTRAVIDVLIEKGNLSEEEIRAIRVLGELRLTEDGPVAERGQPMGSVMSFPLLCLINKGIVDLSFNDLLTTGKLSYLEWKSHRCLINGDDLLLRNPRKDVDVAPLVRYHGLRTGLIVNEEKTLRSTELGEINSKLFENGKGQRKFNASAVWMDHEVCDVLGFSAEASHDTRTFARLVRANCHILSKQENKELWSLPPHLQAVCRKDKKIRRALVSVPLRIRPKVKGVVTVEPMPDGYFLEREEECAAIREEVTRVRPLALARMSVRPVPFRTSVVRDAVSFSSLLKRPDTCPKDITLSCLARAFREKIKRQMIEDDVAIELSPEDELSLYSGSLIDGLVDIIRRGLPSKQRVPIVGTDTDFVSLDIGNVCI
jgi:hypothetical protein